ncbi:ferredoxin [Streptomyces mirabilis]|uniref:ferredoxin n=1 Tax=Streptomyces mirabilis TaxID=68239 RepID=UPI0036AF042D
MKVAVDRERCEGHGSCQETAPQVFEVAEDGTVRMLMIRSGKPRGRRSYRDASLPGRGTDPSRRPPVANHSTVVPPSPRGVLTQPTWQWPAAPMHR